MRKVTVEIELGKWVKEVRRPIFEHIRSYEVLEVLKIDYEEGLYVDLVEFETREGVDIRDLEHIGNMEVLSILKSEGDRHTCIIRGHETEMTSDEYKELDLDLVYTTPSYQSEDRMVISFIGAQRNLLRFVELMRGSDIGEITNMSITGADYQKRYVLSVLTDKQREVMVAAYRYGYYDLPKRISSERLAERVGISKPTMLEHMRKAERRIMGEIMAGHA
jgi:predicted DNA binding protein